MRTTCTSNSTGLGENTLMLQIESIFRLNVPGRPRVMGESGGGEWKWGLGDKHQSCEWGDRSRWQLRSLCRGFVLDTALSYQQSKDLQNLCQVRLFLANTLQLEARKNTRGLGNCWRDVSYISFEVLLKLMSSFVVSLSSIFHSECKPETNLPLKIVWKSSPTSLCFRGTDQGWGGWNKIHCDQEHRGGNHHCSQTMCYGQRVNVQAFCAFVTKINYVCSITLCSIAMSTQLHKFTICASVCLHEMFQLYFLQ